MFVSVVLYIFSKGCSWPYAALAAIIVDGSTSAIPHVGDATGTHVEAVSVIRVGIQAVGFPVAEAGPGGMGCDRGGCGWARGGARARFWGGGGRQWGQL